MRLAIPGITLPDNTSEVTKSVSHVKDARGMADKRVETLSVSCKFTTDDLSNLDPYFIQQTLLLINGSTATVKFLNNNGIEIRHLTLNGGNSLAGLQLISGPDYPNGGGVELASIRTMNFTLQAEFDEANNQDESFSESVTITGTGGPDVIPVVFLDGTVEHQVVATSTPIFGAQSGSWVRKDGYPSPPAPIWAGIGIELAPSRKISKTSPVRYGLTDKGSFRTSWDYNYLLTSPIVPNPNEQ